MMSANAHLLVHNIVAVLSLIVSTAIIFFVLRKNYRRTENVTMALTILAVIVFLISHLLGVNTSNPVLSRQFFTWNLSVIFISVFNFHCVMAAIGRAKRKLGLIVTVYLIGGAFVALYLLFPDKFLLTSMPKMYFPDYYVAGAWQWLMRLVFNILLPTYFIYELARAYRRTADTIERNRYRYFALALALGWITGLIPLFLIWNIPVDPVWGMFFPVVFAVPFTYAIVRYELMDIRVIAKKAFGFSAAVILVGFLIAGFDLLDQLVLRLDPNFPYWFTPLVSGIMIVTVGWLVWRRLRENEILKYEFITTVTHKFRTPLTHIKWATENLRQTTIPSGESNEQLGYIEEANAKLVELTDLLAQTSENEEQPYQYELIPHDFSDFARDVAHNLEPHAVLKKIHLETRIAPGLQAAYDENRLRFVLQTLLENAISYTPSGGTITLTVEPNGHKLRCTVTDTGIGITKTELPLISSKLYRGSRARTADTEGMGIGLYIAKQILGRHHSRLSISSAGIDKGSTFDFTLERLTPDQS